MLIQLFRRDLNQLFEEINFYENEANLWKIDSAKTNSAEALCLHLIGNWNHFIGAILG